MSSAYEIGPDGNLRLRNREGRLGPLQKTPSADHPYYKGSWSKIMHGSTYYATEKGLDYYHGSFEQYPKDNQQAIWIQTLFENAPQTRQAYVDQTNDLFNSGVTLQDHHTAEYIPAEFLDRGYITFNPEEAADY
tara:strand:- start:887 stop:1288 length:402 start_codon:yes stop_codon:yes gene_type:complete